MFGGFFIWGQLGKWDKEEGERMEVVNTCGQDGICHVSLVKGVTLECQW